MTNYPSFCGGAGNMDTPMMPVNDDDEQPEPKADRSGWPVSALDYADERT